jgi:flagellar hook-associated protein 3 FlgL
MGFRISTSWLYHTTERQLMDNLERLYAAEEAVVTGKKLRRPGDGPAAFTRCMNYKSMERTLGQYERNISSSQAYLAEAESSLQSMTHLLTRAKELAMQGASGGLDAETLAGNAIEIGSLYDQMLSLSNALWPGGAGSGARHIFSGFKSDQAAFDPSGVYQGDQGAYQVEIAPGEWMTIGLVGSDVFQGDVDVFGVMQTLQTALENGDADGIQSTLDDLDRAIWQTSLGLSEIGARVNRLDQAAIRLEDIEISVRTFISQEEDVDLIQAASELTRYEQALSASISATQVILSTMTIL